jgi:hypothetical protein
MNKIFDIYFNNAPPDIDGGFHELRIIEVRKNLRKIILPQPQGWNFYDVHVGRSEYRAITAYCRFLGCQPSQYVNGSVSTYQFRMDYQHWPIIWNMIETGLAQ